MKWISLFSGAGCGDLGLHRAGHEVVAMVSEMLELADLQADILISQETLLCLADTLDELLDMLLLLCTAPAGDIHHEGMDTVALVLMDHVGRLVLLVRALLTEGQLAKNFVKCVDRLLEFNGADLIPLVDQQICLLLDGLLPYAHVVQKLHQHRVFRLDVVKPLELLLEKAVPLQANFFVLNAVGEHALGVAVRSGLASMGLAGLGLQVRIHHPRGLISS